MKWTIREAVDVYFKALSTFKLGSKTFRKNEPILILDTVKVGTSEITAEESYVSGGRGNSRLLSFEGDKAMTFSFEDALLSNEGLAILSGAELIPARDYSYGVGESVISHKTDKFTLNTDGIVQFSRVPFVGHGSDIYAILMDDNGEFNGSPIQIQYNINSQVNNGANLLMTSVPTDNNTIVGFDAKLNPIELDANDNEGEITYSIPKNYFDRVICFKDGNGENEKYQITMSMAATDTIKANIKSKPLINNAGYCIATIPSLKAGDSIILDYYVEYRHDATQFSILPNKFAPYMYVEGSSLIKRQSDGLDIPVEFEIPKFKIKTAITLTMQSTGDASTFTFSGDAYKAYSKFDKTRQVLANIKILDADDNYDLVNDSNSGDQTSYERYQYDQNNEGEYIWKDAEKQSHQNIDKTDINMGINYYTASPELN